MRDIHTVYVLPHQIQVHVHEQPHQVLPLSQGQGNLEKNSLKKIKNY